MVSNDVPLWMNAEVAQADAVLRKIALEMRSEVSAIVFIFGRCLSVICAPHCFSCFPSFVLQYA